MVAALGPGGRTPGDIGSGTIPMTSPIPQGTVFTVSSSPRVVLPDLAMPARLQLNVSLSCHELSAPRTNDWTAWVYPHPPLSQQPHRATLVSHSSRRASDGVTQPLTFVSSRILAKVRLAVPSALSLPTGSVWPAYNALYIVTQDDAESIPALVNAVTTGARVLVAELTSCLSTGGCAHTGTLIPHDRLPTLFHSPYWTVSEVTPVGLGVLDSAAVPKGLRDLSGAHGAIDNSFFPAFGPIPGRCAGRTRSGTSFTVPGAASSSSAVNVWAEAIFAQDFAGPSTVPGNFDIILDHFSLSPGSRNYQLYATMHARAP